MTYKRTALADSTIEITVTYPWKEIAAAYEKALDAKVASLEIDGFRKGKVPKKIALDHIDPKHVYTDVIEKIVPETYRSIVETEKLKPIIRPEITLAKAKEKEDWEIVIRTAEIPDIKLGDYRKALQGNRKKESLWVPGKDEKKPEEKTPEKNLDQVVKAILDTTTATISGLLISVEVNRMLSDLVDRTRQLGLTVDQYLAARNTNQEAIRQEYETDAKNRIVIEMALELIADQEKIEVSDQEISAFIAKAKTDQEKAELEKERYQLAQLIKRNKTLDRLLSYA